MRRRMRGLVVPFLRRSDGVATADWVILACGATAMGVMVLTRGLESLGGYSAGVRDELQNGEFDASWVEALPINQP